MNEFILLNAIIWKKPAFRKVLTDWKVLNYDGILDIELIIIPISQIQMVRGFETSIDLSRIHYNIKQRIDISSDNIGGSFVYMKPFNDIPVRQYRRCIDVLEKPKTIIDKMSE